MIQKKPNYKKLINKQFKNSLNLQYQLIFKEYLSITFYIKFKLKINLIKQYRCLLFLIINKKIICFHNDYFYKLEKILHNHIIF